MHLILVRHGEAGKAPRDDERTLTDFGREQIRSLSQKSKSLLQNIPIHKVFHSPLVRAKQTTDIIVEGLGLEAPLQVEGRLTPESNPESIGEDVEYGKSNENWLLVGHNPFMPGLAQYFLPDRFIGFSTGTMICLKKSDGKWKLEWECRP